MNNERLMKVLLSPLISEKSSIVADANRQFTFRVVKDATKQEIAAAVEKLFDVEVERVQVVNVKGKKKRFGQIQGRRSDWRKAYVRLKEGNDIDFAGGA
ncbi:50S ribosomal protein L23 [Candidatus Endoriftia persephonae]|jgi:large subunit ribosomal protein L23|uniref:Large ribosomal subunit protein uL23 n=4 Tax=Gammaproteobacteria TaxID=1236 RepID=G2FAS3_9GAMM|nr:50S ribosomal protein L23 [Candidatus Endoriftia persephone]EGV51637.1 50S ribosomal protein L23 [endosymbiont of Riftia pachyptila (vent Ph05)]EGW55861.1 50S ribosomal protein L23 [endosymbiont of Tevnia jerichonana (vent Tica)]KRT56493.1 LSU ribosomal protein L23P [endosymbiont of Ridgeia piscesae]KRT58974.1 LSU ribosomal protein L23P [endosymbiont of Ridgeia piscesae]USF87999.1 50S ribosomal protein L23 [Candidatus Endoriftia persephone]